MKAPSTIRPLFLSALLALLAAPAPAAVVEEKTALAAAEAFVSSDAVGRAILGGRSVQSAEARGRLWIVRLSPAGRVIVSGSDRADPIVGFAKTDFAEPDPDSPAYALLEGTSAAMDALEADETATRHARWDELLGGGAKRGGAKASDPPASAIVVEPFVAAHYNQWQPYNDYTPVCEATTKNDVYRGRDPCGCVATAAAQVLRHFRWPAIIGGTRTVDHAWYDRDSSGEAFTVRFDGRAPLDWNAFSDNYIYYSNGYELRGKVAESVRYPIARLVLWADSLGEMYFTSGGSGANYGDVAANVSEWFFPGEDLDASGDLSAAVESFCNGIPCPVSLDGHQVLGHGWASDGGSQYIYLNFGWGGSSDGWYAIPGVADDMEIETVLAGHFPRAKPQLDPLPAVTEPSVTLSWHFPDIHTNALREFFVQLFAAASAPETSTETFSDFAGSLAGTGVEIGATAGYAGAGLVLPPSENGSCTLPGSFILSATSVVSFRYQSYYAQGSSLKLLARFDGGDWEAIAAPSLPNTGKSSWGIASVGLGDRDGRTVQLRIANEFRGGSYYPSGWIHVDDVSVTDAFPMRESLHFTARADERSLAIGDGHLAPGAHYAATVKPVLSAVALAPAETSDPVPWTVADETRSLVALGMPEILAVETAHGTDMQEGFYRECSREGTVLYVTCSPYVTALRALPSHLSLIPDSAVTVHSLGGGEFAVEIDGSGVTADVDRTRMILTLEATDANGTTVCKDLSLRFSSASGAASEDAWAVEVGGTRVADGTSWTADLPYVWLVRNELAPKGSTDAAFAAAANADTDGDGLANWGEWVCGSAPTNATEHLRVLLEMTNGVPALDYAPHTLRDGFVPVYVGTESLSPDVWEPAVLDRHRFFRVRAEKP